MRRKVTAVSLLVCLVLLLSVTVFARPVDLDAVGSVSVTLVDQREKEPVAHVEIAVYQVAYVEDYENGRLIYAYTEEFEDCGFALTDKNLAGKLADFAEGSIRPDLLVETDSYGRVTVTDLPLGLYLIVQTEPSEKGVICMPFLVRVPNKTEGGYDYDVNARPKADVVETTDITVRKVWNVDETVKISDSVTVHLLRDGTVVKTATLSEENGWEAVFYDMPCSDAYSIVEAYVPEGFTETYRQQGYVFTVINSASLPQTGQTVWPIPVLAVAGLFLIAVGAACVKKSRERNA